MTKAKLYMAVAFAVTIFLVSPALAMAAIDAETVVTGKCTACHMADRIRKSQKTKTEWTTLIDKEIERGADLTRGERRAVIDWLAENYGRTEVAQTEPVPAQTQVATQSAATTGSLPFNEQARTGVELWQFLLSGGLLISGGAFIRRRR